MNKSFIKSGLVVIAALVLASCSKTDEFQHNPDSALQIESVSGISPFALTTKAVITGNTLPDSEAATGIGIFVTASDGGAYDGHNEGYTNVNFANGGSGWSTATPVYLSDTEGKLYGYFPYDSEANDLRAVPVASSLNGTDYLYAEPQTVSHSNKSVSLQMNHALSRLHLTVKKGANFTASAPLSKITLKSTAIDATGTMDITTGAITASKGVDETGTVELATDGTITAEGIEKDILLVPADNSEGKKDIAIYLLIDGKPAGITLSGENGIDIRSGIQNNVTLTIEDTGIKVTGVGVGEWGEGGSQQVQVGKHTVTVKLSEDAGIADNLIVQCKPDGNSVKIEAYSKSGNSLSCVITGNATCTKVMADNICTFTISGITSNVTAIVEYKKAEIINLDRTSVNPALGWVVSLSAEVLPEDTVIKDVIWSSNNETIAKVDDYGTVTTFTEGEAIITATAKDGSGVTTTCKITVGPAIAGSLSGEFSVSVKKKVHFSQGNLYYDGSVKAFKFETNQYDYHTYDTGSNTWGLFGWSTPATTYGMSTSENERYYSGNFLDWGTAIDSKSTWTTLSGGKSGEWKYLFDHHVSIWGNCNSVPGRFIAPDNFVGGTAALSAIVSDWKTAQDAGIVFLPAAGYRSGPEVRSVGRQVRYWSSTAYDSYNAYYVYLTSDEVKPDDELYRNYGLSVRLITECQ